MSNDLFPRRLHLSRFIDLPTANYIPTTAGSSYLLEPGQTNCLVVETQFPLAGEKGRAKFS